MSIHKKISFIKSGIRLLGYVIGGLAFYDNPVAHAAFAILFGSEIIGVIEELGEK